MTDAEGRLELPVGVENPQSTSAKNDDAVATLIVMVSLINGEMLKPPEKSYKLTFGIGLWLVGIATTIGVVINLAKTDGKNEPTPIRKNLRFFRDSRPEKVALRAAVS